MKPRFQADNDLNQRIVSAVLRREPAINFRTAVDAGFHEGADDLQVLALTANDGRILVTHDRRTMPTHFAEFRMSSHSPGVILVPKRMPIGQAAEWLLLIWFASEAEEYLDTLYSLPRT